MLFINHIFNNLLYITLPKPVLYISKFALLRKKITIMKQKNVAYCLAIAMLVVCQCCNAQKRVLVGIQGGASIADLTGGSNSNPFSTGFSSKFGGDAGLVASFQVKRSFPFRWSLITQHRGLTKKEPRPCR